MKKKIINLLFLSNLLIAFGQAKVCETSKENTFDENTITINKCSVEDKQVKDITAVRKRVVRKKHHRLKTGHLKVESKKIDFEMNNNEIVKKIKLTNKMLFGLVDRVPMFDSCEKLTEKENVKCFKTKINEHFFKHFIVDKLIGEDVSKKVFIQFDIGLNGKVFNAKVKTTNKHLKNELLRVLKKLPVFTPGYQKELAVVVTYSFPFNLTLN